MVHADGSGPGWGEVMHILHHTRSGEPHTVRDLPAPFSYCIESIQYSLVRQEQLVEIRWDLAQIFFPCPESHRILWVVDWTDSGSAHITTNAHTHTLNEWMQKVWSETKCYKCSEREHGLEEKKEKSWHHSECWIAVIVIGRKRNRKGQPVAAQQVYQTVNDQNVNL